MLNFTKPILDLQILKQYSCEKSRFSNKTYTNATLFTRIPAWNHLGLWSAFFGFYRPLIAWDVAKEDGGFSVCAD